MKWHLASYSFQENLGFKQSSGLNLKLLSHNKMVIYCIKDFKIDIAIQILDAKFMHYVYCQCL